MLATDLDQPATGRLVDGTHRFPVCACFEDNALSGIVYHVDAASDAVQQRVMRANEISPEADVTAGLFGAWGRPIRQPRAWITAFGRAMPAGDRHQ